MVIHDVPEAPVFASLDVLATATVDAIRAQFAQAVAKHGIERTPLCPAMPSGTALTVLVEEVGEVARALSYDEGDSRALHTELLQVAAVAAMWAQALTNPAPEPACQPAIGTSLPSLEATP